MSEKVRLINVRRYIKLRKKLDLLGLKRDSVVKEMRELRANFSVFEFDILAKIRKNRREKS